MICVRKGHKFAICRKVSVMEFKLYTAKLQTWLGLARR